MLFLPPLLAISKVVHPLSRHVKESLCKESLCRSKAFKSWASKCCGNQSPLPNCDQLWSVQHVCKRKERYHLPQPQPSILCSINHVVYFQKKTLFRQIGRFSLRRHKHRHLCLDGKGMATKDCCMQFVAFFWFSRSKSWTPRGSVLPRHLVRRFSGKCAPVSMTRAIRAWCLSGGSFVAC